MRNARLDEAQAGIKISGRNIHNLRYADDTTTLMAESEDYLKNLLMKVKEESEKAGLTDPTTSWQTDGETMETVRDFIFLSSKITADGVWKFLVQVQLKPGLKNFEHYFTSV